MEESENLLTRWLLDVPWLRICGQGFASGKFPKEAGGLRMRDPLWLMRYDSGGIFWGLSMMLIDLLSLGEI